MTAASKAVDNSKKVSFDISYILAFVAKRKAGSNMSNMWAKLVGRELDHIKRINLSLTKKVMNNQVYALTQVVQVEVLPPKGESKNWIGITAGI